MNNVRNACNTSFGYKSTWYDKSLSHYLLFSAEDQCLNSMKATDSSEGDAHMKKQRLLNWLEASG